MTGSLHTWTDANAEATGLGGYLASILSAGENTFIFSLLPQEQYIWIGFREVNEIWAWSSGEPVTYTNWRSGEPNNLQGLEDSGIIYGPVEVVPGAWNDLRGTNLNYGVIEWNSEPTSVPEPASFAIVGLGLLLPLLMGRRRR